VRQMQGQAVEGAVQGVSSLSLLRLHTGVHEVRVPQVPQKGECGKLIVLAFAVRSSKLSDPFTKHKRAFWPLVPIVAFCRFSAASPSVLDKSGRISGQLGFHSLPFAVLAFLPFWPLAVFRLLPPACWTRAAEFLANLGSTSLLPFTACALCAPHLYC